MRLRNILPLVALLAVPAMAQDVHFGFQAGISSPMGGSSDKTNGTEYSVKDFVDSKMGFTVGINVPIEFNGGHTLRPRLDYTYDKGTTDLGYGDTDNKVTTTHFGVDYLYNFNGKAGEGFYILAGVGYADSKFEIASGPFSISESKSAFAWGIGGGYEFTPMFGVELRYASTHPTFNNYLGSGVDLQGKNDSLNLTATFRF